MNVSPKYWGHSGWIFLHCIANCFPDNANAETKNKYRDFFLAMDTILPCDICKANYAKHLAKFPMNYDVLSSKKHLNRWLLNIHNAVLHELGKPPKTQAMIDSEIYGNNNVKIFIAAGLLIVILGFLLYKSRQ
jgi:hypothetical protein